MKNPTTAINDGTCSIDSPVMAWPDVQPPAYLVPNPIKNPPPRNINRPFADNKKFQLNIC
jgi:hypothetical protein